MLRKLKQKARLRRYDCSCEGGSHSCPNCSANGPHVRRSSITWLKQHRPFSMGKHAPAPQAFEIPRPVELSSSPVPTPPPTTIPGAVAVTTTVALSASCWRCDRCTFLNSGDVLTCEACCISSRLTRGSGNWRCRQCKFFNSACVMRCEVCRGPKRLSSAEVRDPRERFWKCKRCTFENPPFSLCCDACYQDRVSDDGSQSRLREDTDSYRCWKANDVVLRSARGVAEVGWVRSSHLDEQLGQQEIDATAHIAELCSAARATQSLFSDPDFPPCSRSLYGDPSRPRLFMGQGTSGPDWEWKRPHQLGTPWVVIRDKVQSTDIVQGKLGNCWLLSTLSVLAARPHLIHRLLLTKQYNPEGAYAVRFFYDGEWQRVVVDDLFPTRNNKLVYGHCQDQQLWVSIVEKAYAKLHGSYAAIVCGQTAHAMYDLTGAPCESIDMEKDDFDPAKLWVLLVTYRQSNFLMGAACGRQGATDKSLEQVGLIINHAYSLVDVLIEDSHKLIKLRNPWGHAEWKGDWGPASNRWIPAMRERLAYPEAQDGTFWMAFDDFIKHFAAVDVCKEQASWHSLCIHDVFPHADSMLPSKMFELKVVSSTWMFGMLIQNSKRRETPINEHEAFAMLIDECCAGLDAFDSYRPLAQLWPTMARISHVEFLTTQDWHSYLLMPFSTSPRTGPMDYTFAIYSANPISIRPVPCNALALARNLHCAILSAAPPRELFPDLVIHLIQRDSSVCVLAVNRDPLRHIYIHTDCTSSVNLTSTRKSLATSDVLPPRTRQLLMVLTQVLGTTYYLWDCKYSFAKMSAAQLARHNYPTHHPPVTDTASIHAQQEMIHYSATFPLD
eukprot:GGOE01003830.1.p1 GENE.GGOE01003830.1~~GGOE01003830.1.p1  ORF type:complete len:838 (-),score=157.55 GGOE01003830.1:459-2972(-)